jgi:hypothetical protein
MAQATILATLMIKLIPNIYPLPPIAGERVRERGLFHLTSLPSTPSKVEGGFFCSRLKLFVGVFVSTVLTLTDRCGVR